MSSGLFFSGMYRTWKASRSIKVSKYWRRSRFSGLYQAYQDKMLSKIDIKITGFTADGTPVDYHCDGKNFNVISYQKDTVYFKPLGPGSYSLQIVITYKDFEKMVVI